MLRKLVRCCPMPQKNEVIGWSLLLGGVVALIAIPGQKVASFTFLGGYIGGLVFNFKSINQVRTSI